MMLDIDNLKLNLQKGDVRTIARCISIVENDVNGYEELLISLKPNKDIPVIGITGPPGAGKSSLINELLELTSEKKIKTAVVAVDPTSPFNFGSLLGDRVRMSQFYNNPFVYIRSLASRGSLGGLSAKIIEVVDVLRSADFDLIFIETVGVGQSEVEVAGLADVTAVVTVPESGDDIQVIKSGLMEIADVFVVNKSDRDKDGKYARHLKKMLLSKVSESEIAVISTSVTENAGIDELLNKFLNLTTSKSVNEKFFYLMGEKAYRLIQKKRMSDTNKVELVKEIKECLQKNPDNFNLYEFVNRKA